MKEESLPEGLLWQIFSLIALIPHPSGEEAELRARLQDFAEIHDLKVETDAVGNLRLERAPSPGLEQAPSIVLQGHLDMVPQRRSGSDFRFSEDSINLVRSGDWVHTGGETTLGADNGIGVAAALAVLLDRTKQVGPLSAVFTVEEETGLRGALQLPPQWLQADYLLNLDSEDEGELYIGCAGGARLNSIFQLHPTVPSAGQGMKITLSGLPGGHSGCDIDRNRGNANQLLAQFLHLFPALQLASFDGGSLDNAIPRECEATAVVSDELKAALLSAASAFVGSVREELGENGRNLSLQLVEIPRPEWVWSPEEQQTILIHLTHCPNGVQRYDDAFKVVALSSNLASVKTEPTARQLIVRSSQRGFDEEERSALTRKIAGYMTEAGAEATVDNSYPGWKPQGDSALLRTANAVYEELFGVKPANTVIHAGLECGILHAKNPDLAMISFGPEIQNPHSPSERVSIASVERFEQFLDALIGCLVKKGKVSAC